MSEDQKPPEWAAGIAAAFGKALGWRVAIMVMGFAITIVGGVYYALEITVRPLQEQITNNQSTLTAALNTANSTASERLLAIEGSLETRLTAINENITTIGEALARLDERSLTAIGHIEELRVATAKALDQSNDLNLQLVALNARLEGAAFQRQNSPLIQEQNWRQTDDPRFPNGLFQDIDLNDWHVEPMRPLDYLDDDTAPLLLQVSRKDSRRILKIVGGTPYELVVDGPFKIEPARRSVAERIPSFEWSEMEIYYSGHGSTFPRFPAGCFELDQRFSSISEMVALARNSAPEYVDRFEFVMAREAETFSLDNGIYAYVTPPIVMVAGFNIYSSLDLPLSDRERITCFRRSSE